MQDLFLYTIGITYFASYKSCTFLTTNYNGTTYGQVSLEKRRTMHNSFGYAQFT